LTPRGSRPDVRRARSEAVRQAAIVAALSAAGRIPVRVHSGKVKVRGGWMQLAPNGTPDLYVVGWGWLECKTDTGKLNADQMRMHRLLRAEGERVAVVRSAAEALRAVISNQVGTGTEGVKHG
jgi:hypothetical protein